MKVSGTRNTNLICLDIKLWYNPNQRPRKVLIISSKPDHKSSLKLYPLFVQHLFFMLITKIVVAHFCATPMLMIYFSTLVKRILLCFPFKSELNRDSYCISKKYLNLVTTFTLNLQLYLSLFFIYNPTKAYKTRKITYFWNLYSYCTSTQRKRLKYLFTGGLL